MSMCWVDYLHLSLIRFGWGTWQVLWVAWACSQLARQCCSSSWHQMLSWLCPDSAYCPRLQRSPMTCCGTLVKGVRPVNIATLSSMSLAYAVLPHGCTMHWQIFVSLRGYQVTINTIPVCCATWYSLLSTAARCCYGAVARGTQSANTAKAESVCCCCQNSTACMHIQDACCS